MERALVVIWLGVGAAIFCITIALVVAIKKKK